jgi:hypothetical protein
VASHSPVHQPRWSTSTAYAMGRASAALATPRAGWHRAGRRRR